MTITLNTIAMNSEKKPSVTVKKKNIQTILDYCLDTKQEFTVLPKAGTDEWNIEINITEINKAISFGMFLRENKMEANGVTPYVAPAKEAAAPKSKAEKAAESKVVKEVVVKDDSASLLDLESPSFEFEDAFQK
jgi:hypothetical protein